jgi:hypothetical protein
MYSLKNILYLGKKPSLVVRAEGLHPRGRGLNPPVYWMYASDASYFIFNKKRNTGSQMGHTKTIFKKKLTRTTKGSIV